MKKYVLYIILFVLFMPFIVNAKEYCDVISGNGKDIGSEIACGAEHFYIIDNKNNELSLLAKYNLNVGYVLTVKENLTGDECINYREKKVREYYGNDFNGDIYGVSSGNYYQKGNINYCTVGVLLHEDVLQSDKAIGAHGSKNGTPEYPEYGVFTIKYNFGMFNNYGDVYSKNFIDAKANYIVDDGWQNTLYENLQDYKNNLLDMGYDIRDVDLITVKEINNIVEKISNKSLPLESWMDNVDWDGIDKPSLDGDGYYLIGDLKEYLPKGYEWIYSTTYWTRTLYYSNDTNLDEEQYPYFIDTLGNLCDGYECWGMLGAGIRPVVTLDKSNIKYKIFTKTDGNGTIDVVNNAFGGDSISFRVTAKRGLKLAGLTVISDSGEKIEFNEKDITQDSTGVYSISTNLFTMPFENVTIEARWNSNFINPNTGVNLFIIIICVLIISISSCLFVIKKKSSIK